MYDDPNAPCMDLLIVRSNALLAAAISLQGNSMLPVPSDRVFKRAREYEAFIGRPVTEDPESDRPSTLTTVRIGGASDA
jgi:hypothetical protein